MIQMNSSYNIAQISISLSMNSMRIKKKLRVRLESDQRLQSMSLQLTELTY